MGTLSNGMVLNELYDLQCRIKELEKENLDLRGRLNECYDFIHNMGNHQTLGNSERLSVLTSKFGIDEYPLE